MNKEIHYEGWLIKSPPTKRIWRARWRRRWFTLKQGEIPEQFCLEYYTDRNCRKLKGVIDLDQCEQVDCGLRLENRKQKFQYMFDIKTPKRTYYLAADTETDMRDWVNCICQVCHLHDIKQTNELQEDVNQTQNIASALSTNTTTTSLNSSSGLHQSLLSNNVSCSGSSASNSDILRRTMGGAASNNSGAAAAAVIDQQPKSINATATYTNNSDSVYVNADYTNRETMLCDARFDRQQLPAAAGATNTTTQQPHSELQQHQQRSSVAAASSTSNVNSSAGAALYLNSSIFQAHSLNDNGRLAINANGVVRKIPENLVLNNTPLPETQQHSVQPSPALSTASGPYIPISECFSGSPKFLLDSNNPTTPLNNLDPKFYDTPRSHNNIGLNLTNDQSYSPKITNCSLQQIADTKNRNHRSDSDSESVFTDDDEWTHPLPLRENVDRNTRPSESSVENESFVVTWSQRFSKLPDDMGGKEQKPESTSGIDQLDKLAKVLKNKNNLILDFKENEKTIRDMPQLSDTENTSPAIMGPGDATSVVEESYDIPRSHNLPYYNMGQLFEKVNSPEANPIAASTPNLMSSASACSTLGNSGSLENKLTSSPSHVRTLPRPHCYTNASATKVEGNVFRYDFIEQTNLPPVNRKLKPKVNVEDKPPEEVPAKPPVAQPNSPRTLDALTNKFLAATVHSAGANTAVGICSENSPLKPPSVDRKLKPNAYKVGSSATMSPAIRRSTGAPLSMVLPSESDTYVMETRTLPRHPRPMFSNGANNCAISGGASIAIQHQRTASAAAAMQIPQTQLQQQQPQTLSSSPSNQNEHKLQYFDLDVANPPAINRQSMSVGNLYAGSTRLGLATDQSARAPVKSSVVYNSVDFVKTEAFKRIREERKKENEGGGTPK